MQFNSYSYLLLLIPVVGLYWMIPAAYRRAYLLAISFLFYASWNLAYTALPVLISASVWFCARNLSSGKNARLWFALGLAAPTAILLFFKYRFFAAAGLGALLGRPLPAPLPELLLPLGISFYTFEAISYLIDTKQGRVKEVRFSDLALFVSYWPHMIAGPIVRVRELIPQFQKALQFQSGMIFRGMDRLLWGLAQKNVLANSLASWVDEGFLPQAVKSNSTLDNWVLAFAFGFQIYLDFAAYSNMAIGASRMLGINLPENFRFPYHAANPADFWSRWHMTLSRWIRDYVFFPVNAAYQGRPLALYLSLVGTMALVGLWHGAGWGFILWGVLHGIYMVLYRMAEQWDGSKNRMVSLGIQLLTVLAVMLAWIPFRAATLDQSLRMLHSMVFGFQFTLGMSVNFYLLAFGALLFCLVEPKLVDWIRAALRHRSSWFWRPAAYALLLLLFLVFDDKDVQFIYFQF